MHTRRMTLIGLLATLLAGGCAGQLTPQQRVLLDEGEEAYRSQRYGLASDKLGRFVLSASPETEGYGRALYMRGMAAAQTGRRQEAYLDLQTCVNTAPDEDIVWRAYVSLGTLHFEDQHWNDAALAYRAAADRMPDAAPRDTVLYRLGICYERAGQWSKARLPLNEVVRRYPDSVAARSARQKLNRTENRTPIVTRRATPAATPPPAASGGSAPSAGQFAVQAGVFSMPANAERQVARLRSRNLNAFVRREVVQRQERYVVLVGPYPSYEAARGRLADVKRIVPDAVVWP